MGPHPVGAVPAADADAELRVLLSHYPRLAAAGYHLVLAGHMHAGQIVLPFPGGKIRFAHPRAKLVRGVVPARGSRAPRVTGPRHDVSTPPLLRPARGDRAGSKIGGVTEGHSVISPDVLATYAADAAREVEGVRELAGKGVKVARDEGQVAVEVHLVLAWGAHAGEVGARVQAKVADCLARMADVRPQTIDVIVDEWHSASSG